MNTPKVGDIWYRYTDSYGFQGFTDPDGHEEAYLEKFVVVGVTKHTVKINVVGLYWNKPKTCYISSGKSFAKPTVEQALESFIIRKKREIVHCERRFLNAQWQLKVGLAQQARAKAPPLQIGYESSSKS